MKLFALLILSVALSACSNKEQHFTGKLHASGYVFSAMDGSSVKKSILLTPKMRLRNAAMGFFVCDSMAFFFNNVSKDRFIDVYNINTAETIGSYIYRGNGKNEFSLISPFTHIYMNEGELKAVSNAPNENTFFTWNISKSQKEKRSIIEDIHTQEWRKHYHSAPTVLSSFEDSLFICTTSSVNYSGSTITAPEIHVINKHIGADSYHITPFDNPIYNPKSSIMSERFFNGALSVKPDEKKIVTAYYYLPLISILDLKTGQLDGYVLGDGIDYSVFKTNMKDAQKYYTRVTCSDDYIYALWNGKTVSEEMQVTGFDVLHVFDWNGNLVDVIKTEHELNEIYFDHFSGILYGCSEAESMLYEINYYRP